LRCACCFAASKLLLGQSAERGLRPRPATVRGAAPEGAAGGGSKIPVSELAPGQSLEGKVVGKYQPAGWFVDVGAEKAGFLKVSELPHKALFLAQGRLKVNETYTVRVLAVNDGRFSLTMREGSLERPQVPRTPKGQKRDVKPFQEVGPEVWLEGQVVDIGFGCVYVAVRPEEGGEVVEGKLKLAEFLDDWPPENPIGSMVKVRVKEVMVRKKSLLLSMKPATEGDP